PRAKDTAVGHPEIRLRIERHRRGIGATAEGAIRRAGEPIIFPDRNRFSDHQRSRRNPTTLVKLRQSKRTLQRHIADSESRGVLSRARFMKPEAGYEAKSESVDQAVLDVGLV